MDVGSVHSMGDHLANLPVDLLGIEFPVPEPERADAVFAIWLLECRMERLERTGRRKTGREIRHIAQVQSAKAGASYLEKIPSSDLEHGGTIATPIRGSRNEIKGVREIYLCIAGLARTRVRPFSGRGRQAIETFFAASRRSGFSLPPASPNAWPSTDVRDSLTRSGLKLGHPPQFRRYRCHFAAG
jgi:hypothetical protein